MVDNKLIKLGLWDTSSRESHDKSRHLYYIQTDVFLICFSVADFLSFKNASTKWYPEVRKYCPNTPIILVGTRTNLRDDPDVVKRLMKRYRRGPITYEEGFTKAKKIDAECYRECSVRNNEGLDKVFEDAVRAAMYGNGHFDSESNTLFIFISSLFIIISIIAKDQYIPEEYRLILVKYI